MIPFVLFPFVAAVAVWLAGRRDVARDPRLSGLVLGLLAGFPLLLQLPKIPLLPSLPGGTEEVAGGFPIGRVVMWIWVTGFTAHLAKLSLAWAGLQRWRKRSELSGVLSGGVELRILEGLRGPVAAGIFRRVVFVPSGWNGWDEETQQTVLAHELAHHERRDPVWRLLAQLAVAVHWYHPLVRWIARRLVLQCEHACDARVLATGVVRPADYARLLCRFAGGGHPAGIAMAERSTLESRVRGLLEPKRRGGFAMVALLAVSTLVFALALALVTRENGGDKPLSETREAELRLSASPFPADSP